MQRADLQWVSTAVSKGQSFISEVSFAKGSYSWLFHMENPSLAFDQAFEEIYAALPSLVGEALSEESSEPFPKNPPMLALDVDTEIQTLRKKCSEGVTIILKKLQEKGTMNQLEKELFEAFSSLSDPSVFTLVILRVVSGQSWREAMKVSTNTLERLFQGAKIVFEEGLFEQAELCFTFLAWFDSKKYEFWMALGHSLFHMAAHEKAVRAYKAASTCFPEDTWPHVFMAACFEAMDDNEEAMASLERGLYHERRKEKPDQELIKSLAKKRDESSRGSNVPIS